MKPQKMHCEDEEKQQLTWIWWQPHQHTNEQLKQKSNKNYIIIAKTTTKRHIYMKIKDSKGQAIFFFFTFF